MSKTYTSDNIENLQFPESVRRRPGMYIGATNSDGLGVILREPADNVLDECGEGHATECDIHIDKDMWHVVDNGRGLPHGKTKIKNPADGSILEVPTIRATVGILHTSGKFNDEAYKVSRGVHGVGIKGTNALSSKFTVHTFSSGKWRSIQYKEGLLVKDVSECEAPIHPRTKKPLSKGTLVSFFPDKKIFGDHRLSKVDLFEWCKMSAYFTPNATITLSSDKSDSTRVFHYANGLLQYVSDRIATLTKQGAEFGLIGEQIFSSSSAAHECVLQFTSYDGNDLLAYTNGLRNTEGGFHVASTLNALRESLTHYLEKKQNFTLTELKDGLVGLINCKLSSPQFDSQTKEKLVDARAGEPLKMILKEEFDAFFKENKELAKSICTRASKLRELKSKFVASKQMLTALKRISKKGLPAKAATAPKAKPEVRELYLLEGDSACFVAGTLVSTSKGNIPIQDLTYEWSGLAYDVETGETKTATFSHSFSVRKVSTLLYVSLSDGTTYGCTPDHLWLTKEGYVPASDLTADHVLLNLDHDVFVTSITTRQLKTPVDVYDVTNLSGQQNFCLSNGSVVHNCGGMRFARDESFQEFLPLKGKPPNCAKNKKEDVTNEEILNIFAMLGLDPKHEDPIANLRVGKVILMPDSDADGPLHGSTMVNVVSEGWMKIRDVAAKFELSTFQVYSLTADGYRVPTNARFPTLTDSSCNTVSITTEEGQVLKCTRNHKWPVHGNIPSHIKQEHRFGYNYIAAEDLLTGMKLLSWNKGNVLSTSTIKTLSLIHTVEPEDFYCLSSDLGNFQIRSHNTGLRSTSYFTGNCHIATLLCAILQKYVPQMFERGMVYVTRVPEYYAISGKNLYYGATATEVSDALTKDGAKAEVNHLKGYGECPSSLLKLFACDPNTRLLSRISPASDDRFELLMSSDTSSRKLLLGI